MKDDKMNFFICDQREQSNELVLEKKVSGKDYLFWGDDNKFPQTLFNLYLNSPVMSGIINGTVDFISGNEVISNLDVVNRDGETINDIVRKIATDYEIFGGFAIQVINLPNKKELYALDMQRVRVNENEDKIYYCKNWGKYGSKIVSYDMFDATKNQPNSVLLYKGHLTRDCYPIPRYIGALDSIRTSCEIGKFHLNNILNNLSSSAIVNFNNGVPSIEVQHDIEKRLNEKFAGADNAGRTLVTFNDSKESAVTIERLGEDRFDEKFQTLSKSTMQEIFIAFRATPELFGFSSEGNGFSKSEFLEAFDLYYKTLVKPVQNDIVRVFERIYGVKDIIKFVPFQISEEGGI